MNKIPSTIRHERGSLSDGQLVRILFMGGALAMMVTLPFFSSLVPQPLFLSIIAILVLGFCSAFTNVSRFVVVIINMTIAIAAFISFEYYALFYYLSLIEQPSSGQILFFIISQALAINFFFRIIF